MPANAVPAAQPDVAVGLLASVMLTPYTYHSSTTCMHLAHICSKTSVVDILMLLAVICRYERAGHTATFTCLLTP